MDINERKAVSVTCSPGLATHLAAELQAFGFAATNMHRGSVMIKASFLDCMKLNYHLRTAYSVLYQLGEFRCGSTDTLYKQINRIAWEKIIDPSEYFTITSNVDTHAVDNTMFANLKAKDAIVDRIMAKRQSRPDSGPMRDAVVINLFWNNDKAWIYLNTSGEKLSDRNYRKMPHKAPLRETLAAGIIMATEYDGSQNLVLPMCGSGTLAIEAAMIAKKFPPASLRSNFGFKHVIDYDERRFKEIRRLAKASAKPTNPIGKIIATDIDPRAIEAAKQNALTAGVNHMIDFNVCDFAETQLPAPPDTPGIIIMNPEYGQRLGETEQLQKDYKRIGEFLKQKCPGWTAYIFSGNKELTASLGLKTSSKQVFFNGKIECRLLKYELYKGSR